MRGKDKSRRRERQEEMSDREAGTPEQSRRSREYEGKLTSFVSRQGLWKEVEREASGEEGGKQGGRTGVVGVTEKQGVWKGGGKVVARW